VPAGVVGEVMGAEWGRLMEAHVGEGKWSVWEVIP